MGLNPPPQWTLYRGFAPISGVVYAVFPRWCVLCLRGQAMIVGPREYDNLCSASADEIGVIVRAEHQPRALPTGHVQANWVWNAEKGLLTEEEIAVGEVGIGRTII